MSELKEYPISYEESRRAQDIIYKLRFLLK